MLKDRVAIVTGASRGIGRAIALHLAQQGAHIVANYKGSLAAAESLAAAIEALGTGARAIIVPADVSKAEDVEKLVKAALTEFKRVDILVNNAGITRDQLTMRMSEDEWDDVLDTNLKGAFLLIKAVMRPMLKQKYGRIVNISSVVGLSGQTGQANYSAAKAGLIGLTKSIARELGSRSITCNAVAPGFIETDMTKSLTEDLKNQIKKQIVLERFGQPEEVAAAVGFLASDSAAYITGQVLTVDGGLVMA